LEPAAGSLRYAGQYPFLSCHLQNPMVDTSTKGETVSIQELNVSSLAQTDAVAKLLIEKGVITEAEFMERQSAVSDLETFSAAFPVTF